MAQDTSWRKSGISQDFGQFWPIKFILLISGLDIGTHGRLSSVVAIVLKFNFILFNYLKVIKCWYFSFHAVKGLSLFTLSYAVFYTCVVISHHAIWYKLSELKQLLALISTMLTQSQWVKVKKANIALVVVLGLMTMVHITILTVLSYKVPNNLIISAIRSHGVSSFASAISQVEWYHYLIFAYLMYSYIVCLSLWYNTTVVLYGYFLYMLYLVEEAYFLNHCESLDVVSVQKMFNLCPLKNVYINHVVKMWLRFEKLFNLMPVMWTCYIFVTASAMISLSKESVIGFTLSEFWSFSSYLAITVAVILFASSCVDKMEEMKMEHTDRLIGTNADTPVFFNMVHEIENKSDFDTKLTEAGDKLVVVDFFATWCGPCKVIAPKLQALSDGTYKGVVVFLKVDVDENEELAQEHKVSAMPTFLFFKKKARVADFAGANETKLIELIEKYK
ncbi:Thioredoxin-2 [Halotydeus destructor]|nr:Thioredoxin-2 [Halotydeus destructor]